LKHATPDSGANGKRSLDELEKVSHAETRKIEDLSGAKEKEIMSIR
jgi:ribosome recycling factor